MLGRKERLWNYWAEKGKVFSWEGFNEGDTLERMVYKKNQREGGKYLGKGDEGRVGCGYKLKLLYCTLKDK